MTEENYRQNNEIFAEPQKFIPEQQPLKHSGFGIASFLISIITGLIVFLLLVMATIMAAQTGGEIDEESPGAIILGLSIIGAGFLYILGIGLAIGGLFQQNRYKVFSILGLVINIFSILGIAGLILIGLLFS